MALRVIRSDSHAVEEAQFGRAGDRALAEAMSTAALVAFVGFAVAPPESDIPPLRAGVEPSLASESVCPEIFDGEISDSFRGFQRRSFRREMLKVLPQPRDIVGELLGIELPESEMHLDWGLAGPGVAAVLGCLSHQRRHDPADG